MYIQLLWEEEGKKTIFSFHQERKGREKGNEARQLVRQKFPTPTFSHRKRGPPIPYRIKREGMGKEEKKGLVRFPAR